MKSRARHPGGQRGRLATGVRQYCAYMMPEQAEAVKKFQHRLRIDTWAEALRVLIDRGLKPKKWDGVVALVDAERERCLKHALDFADDAEPCGSTAALIADGIRSGK